MNQRFKRIIAREYLILLIVLITGFLAYIVPAIHNLLINSKLNHTHLELQILTTEVDSLLADQNEKIERQDSFFVDFSSRFDVGHFPTRDEFWKRSEYLVLVDSIKILWEKFWSKSIINSMTEMGFNSHSDLTTFIQENTLTKEDQLNSAKANENKIIIDNLYHQKEELISRKINKSSQRNIFKVAITSAFLLLFVLRYIIKALLFSVKTLREQ